MLTDQEIEDTRELLRSQFKADLEDLFQALNISEMLETQETTNHISALIENKIDVLKELEGLKNEY
jgi:hypothetical protein